MAVNEWWTGESVGVGKIEVETVGALAHLLHDILEVEWRLEWFVSGGGFDGGQLGVWRFAAVVFDFDFVILFVILSVILFVILIILLLLLFVVAVVLIVLIIVFIFTVRSGCTEDAQDVLHAEPIVIGEPREGACHLLQLLGLRLQREDCCRASGVDVCEVSGMGGNVRVLIIWHGCDGWCGRTRGCCTCEISGVCGKGCELVLCVIGARC